MQRLIASTDGDADYTLCVGGVTPVRQPPLVFGAERIPGNRPQGGVLSAPRHLKRAVRSQVVARLAVAGDRGIRKFCNAELP